MFQRRRIREKEGRSERGNALKDTRVGRALSDALSAGAGKVKDALSTPSNYAPYSEQSFAERTGRKPKFVRRKSKSTPESRKAAQRRNEAKSRGQAKGRMNYYRDRLDRDRKESSSKNQARKGAAEMIQRMDRGLASQESRDGWNSLFDHLEAMGTMPDPTDTEVLEEVLSPEASSSNISNEEVEEVADAIAEDVIPEPYDSAAMDDIGESPTRDATLRNMPDSVRNSIGDVPPRDFIGEFEPEFEPEGLTGEELLSYGRGEPRMSLEDNYLPEGLSAYGPTTEDLEATLAGGNTGEIPQMGPAPEYSNITDKTRELNSPLFREMMDLYTRAQGGDSQARYDLIDMQTDLDRERRIGGKVANPQGRSGRKGIYRTELRNVPQSLLDRIRADNEQWKRGGTSNRRRVNVR
jgi:hypothetical protein